MRRTVSLLIALAIALAAAHAATAQSTNLLVNPGFEGLYSKQCCENTRQFQANTPIEKVQVSFGWTAWWIEPDTAHPAYCEGCTTWARPEYRYSTLIHSGASSQLYFTGYAIHEAGLYQCVSGVRPGQRVQFSLYMYAYSTKENPFAMKVGIDPTGGTNAFSDKIVWGPSYSALNSWLLYSVEAVAQGNAVTVFTYSRPSWAYEVNGVYVDDGSLTVIGQGASTVSGLPPSTYVLNQNPSGAVLSPTGPIPGASGSVNTDSSGATVYTVARGDSLVRISRRFGVTVDSIRAANGLKSDVIRIGQMLIIPGK